MITQRTENEPREPEAGSAFGCDEPDEDEVSPSWPAISADAGTPTAAPEHSPLTVHIACEVCPEHLLVAAPRRSARYGTVDCPGCGTSYVFRLDPGRAGRARDLSTTTLDLVLLAAP